MEITVEEGAIELSANAYAGNEEIESVVIPSSVTKIGTSAFKGCVKLSSVKIADGDKALEIGVSAFEGCTALKRIELPGRCSRFLNGCFKRSGLTELTIGKVGDFIAMDLCLFSGCPAEQTLKSTLENERQSRLAGLRTTHAKAVPTNEVLDGLHAVQLRIGTDVERIRRGLGAVYYLVTHDDDFGFESYRQNYQASCEYFHEVSDWYNAEPCKIENVLIGNFANHVAGVDWGSIPEKQRPNARRGLNELRQICGFISQLRGEELEQARVLEYKNMFCNLFTDQTHHQAFYRVIAAIRPDLVVNVPDAGKLSAVYAWLMDAALSNGDVSDWYRMSLGVRRKLQELLPGKTIYQTGVFSWFIADAFRPDRELSEDRQRRKRKVLGCLRDEDLLRS